MKLALIAVILATLTAASVSQSQGQHSAPAVAPHVAPAPVAAVAPAGRTTTAYTSGSHHVAASSNGASNSTHARTTSAHPTGSYTPWPAGSHFTGPVSPGGFANPLAGTNKGNHGSKGSTGIILLGGGYGYGYGYDPSADDSQASDQQADDQEAGGQQQPQYIFVQQVPDPRGQSASSASRDQSQAVPEQQVEPSVPLRDVGSFTLVTQAGYRLDAVAFTRSADRLVYITADGGRRSIAFRDLDVAATQRLN